MSGFFFKHKENMKSVEKWLAQAHTPLALK